MAARPEGRVLAGVMHAGDVCIALVRLVNRRRQRQKMQTRGGAAEHFKSLYRKWDADRIVAEINNGGEMVEATIRMVDRKCFSCQVFAM